MSSNSAHDGSVFVIDLALNQAMAEGAVIFRGRDYEFLAGRRVKAGMAEIEFGEDLTPAELVQRLAGKLLQRFTQKDKADIAVFGAGAGIGCERDVGGPGRAARPYYGRSETA